MKRFLPLFFAYFAKKIAEKFASSEKSRTFASLSKNKAFLKKFGKVVEWSITAVLKTAVLRGTGGSNPSLSAERTEKGDQIFAHLFCFLSIRQVLPSCRSGISENRKSNLPQNYSFTKQIAIHIPFFPFPPTTLLRGFQRSCCINIRLKLHKIAIYLHTDAKNRV